MRPSVPIAVAVPLGPPAAEPVSLAALKAWLRRDDSDEDALFAALITASRLAVEAASGLVLVTQPWRVPLDAWPGQPVVALPVAPVQRLDGVTVKDATGAPMTVPATSVILDTTTRPARLALRQPVPAPGVPLAGIAIDVTAGFGPPEAVPGPLSLAVMLTAARLVEHRGDTDESIALPLSARALIAPFRWRQP